jgi:hypothetical protein
VRHRQRLLDALGAAVGRRLTGLVVLVAVIWFIGLAAKAAFG